MNYGVIYVKICPPKGHSAEWIKYCHRLSSTPTSLQSNIRQIVNQINSDYKDNIVIPMDITVHPGCTTNPESVEEISKEIYSYYVEMMDRQDVPDCVRCVYSVGELSNINVDSTHHLGPDEVMIKLGRFLDSSDDPGIFKV